jgi:hypothetical protein
MNAIEQFLHVKFHLVQFLLNIRILGLMVLRHLLKSCSLPLVQTLSCSTVVLARMARAITLCDGRPNFDHPYSVYNPTPRTYVKYNVKRTF